jgi:hypothetical protein
MAWLVANLYTLFSMATIVPTIAASMRTMLAAQQAKVVFFFQARKNNA